jgi:hypothetical protein
LCKRRCVPNVGRTDMPQKGEQRRGRTRDSAPLPLSWWLFMASSPHCNAAGAAVCKRTRAMAGGGCRGARHRTQKKRERERERERGQGRAHMQPPWRHSLPPPPPPPRPYASPRTHTPRAPHARTTSTSGCALRANTLYEALLGRSTVWKALADGWGGDGVCMRTPHTHTHTPPRAKPLPEAVHCCKLPRKALGSTHAWSARASKTKHAGILAVCSYAAMLRLAYRYKPVFLSAPHLRNPAHAHMRTRPAAWHMPWCIRGWVDLCVCVAWSCVHARAHNPNRPLTQL